MAVPGADRGHVDLKSNSATQAATLDEILRRGIRVEIEQPPRLPVRVTALVDMQQFVGLLELAVSTVHQGEIDLSAYLGHDLAGNRDPAGVRHGLKPRGDVHALAQQVAPLHDHIADGNPDAQDHGLAVARATSLDGDPLVDPHRAFDGFDRAGEFRQHAIPERLEHAAAMGFDLHADDVPHQPFEPRKRGFLVPRHEAGKPDHVRGQYCRQLPLHLRRLASNQPSDQVTITA